MSVSEKDEILSGTRKKTALTGSLAEKTERGYLLQYFMDKVHKI